MTSDNEEGERGSGMARGTNVTRMVAARSDFDKAVESGDKAAANRAWAVFERARDNSSRDDYLDLYPELRED